MKSKRKRKEKDEKLLLINYGCGCCEFCKVIILEIELVKFFYECDKYKFYLCVFGCLKCNVFIC